MFILLIVLFVFGCNIVVGGCVDISVSMVVVVVVVAVVVDDVSVVVLAWYGINPSRFEYVTLIVFMTRLTINHGVITHPPTYHSIYDIILECHNTITI